MSLVYKLTLKKTILELWYCVIAHLTLFSFYCFLIPQQEILIPLVDSAVIQWHQ